MKPTQPKGIPRREFLELSAKTAAGIGLTSLPLVGSGCLGPSPAKTVHGACYHDCPDRCSWKVTAADGKVTAFQAGDNPYTAGKLCNKMDAFPSDVTYHPDRLLTPLKRTGEKGTGTFTPISWEQAIGEVAGKLRAIVAKSGGEAILPYSFGGNQGLVQGEAIPNRFFARLGASQLERTICGNAAVAGVLAANGQTTGVLPEDCVHSKYLVLWGTNPILSNQHLWPFIQKARDHGATLVVVDPFRSRTTAEADWHIQPRPGTDTALALGMMHIILAEGLQDQDYIDRHTLGIEELRAHVQAHNPATTAQITGLPEETIIAFARAYAQSTPSLIRVLIGMEHQANGASAFRAVAMLPALTGAWRHHGGGLMHMTYELFGEALNWESISLPAELANPATRSINMVELGKALTDPALDPPIEALLVFNSNPAVTTPNQNLVRRGLERPDLLTIVSEHFLTDTARYADYVFPATTVLEHWDLFDSWGSTYLNLNEPAIDPRGESKPNSELFRLLARAMGYTEPYLYQADLEIVKNTLKSDHPYLEGITFESLRQSGGQRLTLPEPWIPHAEGNFKTASGKCHFHDAALEHPLPAYLPVAYSEEELRAYPLHLLTLKTPKYFLNSSHANVGHLLEKEGKPYLEVHPQDAAARNIADGDELKVFNPRGRVFLTARISEKVTPGVVCMPQGYWPSLLKGGSSANALTDHRLTDMGRGGAIQEARVEIEKIV
ncbi:molybdopterin-containing oxidoreductase family protein [Robiginitalea marina]|uniref:Molybdopterin-dependent oxidoreductase n=1 Tax=Robiginitalea marina TaxID=2954105 RepID=A0ABT1AXL8_9FLAO|nr:molybdopterin-dependent oxidoreductase [Robiginitalea marina]MCO5724646.1 molybdopterin-dependent oxidoreductase [Robiginitalea marina]